MFPFACDRAQKRMVRRWSRRLLSILAVELEHSGARVVNDRPTVIVANHISWLDIFVVNALEPSRFIAKSDIRQWPVVGLLVANVGTLFVDRTRRRDAARINAAVGETLARGDIVALFPEGTTTFGHDVLPFHGSLLQPVIDARGQLLPAAIRYTDGDGRHSDAAAYVGETTLMESLRALVSARRTRVVIEIGSPLTATGQHRRRLAADARAHVRALLERTRAETSTTRAPSDHRRYA